MNSDPHSYKDGFREIVVFLMADAVGRALLEFRPDKDGNLTDVFYPSGSIELKDHADSRSDYREIALRREIAEEFRNGVLVGQTRFLGEIKVPEIGLVFYAYWVSSWTGDPGSHTYEDGAPFGELHWVWLDDVARLNPYDSTAKMTAMLRGALARRRAG